MGRSLSILVFCLSGLVSFPPAARADLPAFFRACGEVAKALVIPPAEDARWGDIEMSLSAHEQTRTSAHQDALDAVRAGELVPPTTEQTESRVQAYIAEQMKGASSLSGNDYEALVRSISLETKKMWDEHYELQEEAARRLPARPPLETVESY